jgi:putative spermidine/putrescine transport system substrate-binding protein
MTARSRFRIAALLGSTVAAALAALPAQAAEIVLATWGGSWGKAIAEQAVAPSRRPPA